MALIKSKVGNTTYSWKSDDIRDAEIKELTDVSYVSIITNFEGIINNNVYAQKCGRVLIVSGYFYLETSNDVPDNTKLFTVQQGIAMDAFTSLVSGGIRLGRLKMFTSGEIYSDSILPKLNFYAFQFVAFTN